MRPHRWRQWPSGHNHSRRFVFWRFVFLFGGLVFLFLVGLAIVVILILMLNTPAPHVTPPPPGLVMTICGVPLGFVILATILGSWGFRRMGAPFADFFTAIDAIAEGDLSVRVREHGAGQFARFGRRFNHMVAELERAEQQRRNMTADIAHELRTPLHIIQGNLEGMLDGVYQPDGEKLSATLEETRLLARLVGDLQTLSLAESGQLPLHTAQFTAGDLFSDVVTSYSAQAEEQDITLHYDLAAAIVPITADPDRLNQVFSNLVDNALRHTPAGGQVTLSAAVEGEMVILSVRDNGAGIPPGDLPFIFDRFWRADRARTRGSGAGSGLGLAIARQLVQAHGGEISVESQLGQGALFTVVLPGKR